MTKQKKPMFQKRHYEVIAKVLGAVKSAKLTRKINGDFRYDGYCHSINHTIDLFVNLAKSDNPNFDEARFRNEIGGSEAGVSVSLIDDIGGSIPMNETY